MLISALDTLLQIAGLIDHQHRVGLAARGWTQDGGDFCRDRAHLVNSSVSFGVPRPYGAGMATEKVTPILPCRTLDDTLAFYENLGFEITYRQDRPYPCAGVRRGGIELQFAGIPAFEPEDSYGSVIIGVPDTAALFADFAAGLRAGYGKLPITGIPRITRPRRKQGAGAGFTVVDPGGNWLRIASYGGQEVPEAGGELARVLENAARQADSRGDLGRAVQVLDAGLARHPDAPAADRVPVLAYLAELAFRAGDHERAAAVLAELRTHELDAETAAAVAETAAALEG